MVHGGLLRFETAGDGRSVDPTARVVTTSGGEADEMLLRALAPEHGCRGAGAGALARAYAYARGRAHTWGRGRAPVLGLFEPTPVIGRELMRGTWQQVVLLVFGHRSRVREVTVHLIS